jgi:hypothetical protein
MYAESPVVRLSATTGSSLATFQDELHGDALAIIGETTGSVREYLSSPKSAIRWSWPAR